MGLSISSETTFQLIQPDRDKYYNLQSDDPIHQVAKDLNRRAFAINGKINPAGSNDSPYRGLASLYRKAEAFLNDHSNETERDSFESELKTVLKNELNFSDSEYSAFLQYYSQRILSGADRVTSLLVPDDSSSVTGEDEANIYRKEGVIYCDALRKNILEKSISGTKNYSGEVKASVKFENNRWSLSNIEATENVAKALQDKIPNKERIEKLISKDGGELDDYLKKTLFFVHRNRTPEEFKRSMEGVFDKEHANLLTEKFSLYRLENEISDLYSRGKKRDFIERVETDLFRAFQMEKPEVFKEYMRKNFRFSSKEIDYFDYKFEEYKKDINQQIIKDIETNGLTKAFNNTSKNNISPVTFSNYVAHSLKEIQNISSHKGESYKDFLTGFKDILEKTKWSVGFLGGQTYKGKKYPDHIHKMIVTIDNASKVKNNNWEKTFEEVKRISTKAADNKPLFGRRSKETQTAYDALKKEFTAIRGGGDSNTDNEPQKPDKPHHM